MEEIRGRHELKYYINYFDYLSIKSKIGHIMEVDRNGNGKGDYEIISLYFDDIYNSAYREKISGTNNRTKYRIRIYNFSDSVIKLEKKARNGDLTQKVSRIIYRDEYEEIMKSRASFLLEERPYEFIDFYEGIKTRTLKPKVLVRYNREAYCLRAANLRITFDRNLSTGNNNLDIFDRNGSFTCSGSDLMILEIKYDGFFPSHIKNIVQSIGRFRSSASKYVIGRKYNYLY
ncbi:MAG: polyphosphate polymerase domain-containing protein [Thermotogaceae bacterium]|jgi:SPX domain protein involved in polyphosphate accumulation|nr:polyphosphate polymerase domain-containing protein [Thermotogaceae bacterium]